MTPPRILGLHHVTATVDDAQADLDFCCEQLGLRLVKKTVNFDNHDVYHFYYGNERGEPGTIWTTFPYKGHGVRVGMKGAGQVVTTAFSVPVGSLEAWRNRFRHAGVVTSDLEAYFGEPAIAFNDPSGLRFELIANDRDRRKPWTGAHGAKEAIHGLHSVTMMVRQAAPSIDFLVNTLGYHVVGRDGAIAREPRQAPTRPVISSTWWKTTTLARRSTASARCITWRWRSAATTNRSGCARRWSHAGVGVTDDPRPHLLPLDLFPRAGRGVVRSGDRASPVSRSTKTLLTSGARSQASRVGRRESRLDRAVAGTDCLPTNGSIRSIAAAPPARRR